MKRKSMSRRGLLTGAFGAMMIGGTAASVVAATPGQIGFKPLSATVLYESAPQVSAAMIKTAYSQAFPAAAPGWSFPLDDRLERSPSLLSLAGGDFAALSMDFSLPQDEAFATLMARSQQIWPEAEAALDRHQAHTYLEMLADPKDLTPQARLAGAQELTRVAAVFAGLPGSIGATFGETGAAWPAAHIQAVAALDPLASRLWVRFEESAVDLPNGETGLALQTQGLKVFAGREVTFEPRPWREAAAQRAEAERVTRHLARFGPVFADGETVTLASGGRYLVRHLVSAQTREKLFSLTRV